MWTPPASVTVVEPDERDEAADVARWSTLDVVEIDVRNTAPVPITVTSHFHFLEVNPRLSFDREAAYGRHLDIAAGSSITFEPGGTQRVALVPIRGERVVIGMAGFVDGPLDALGAKERALDLLRATGFLDSAVLDSAVLDSGHDGGTPDPENAVRRVREHLAAHPEVQS